MPFGEPRFLLSFWNCRPLWRHSPPEQDHDPYYPARDSLAIERLREQELEEARLIQSSMLPSQALHADAVVEFQPVAEVGGDYLDCFTPSDETVGLYIGDVSGKGWPAALYAALGVGTLRGVHKTGQHPGRVLALLNQRLCLRGIPGRHSALPVCAFPIL